MSTEKRPTYAAPMAAEILRLEAQADKLAEALRGLAYAVSPMPFGPEPDWENEMIEPHFIEPIRAAREALAEYDE